jgi:queuine tRNA-ribosyltransferase
VEIQETLGADIHMVLDECTPYPATHEQARESMQQMLSEYGVGAAGFTGQSRTLRNAPLYLRFSGDQLAAYSDDQCFDLERVYRRVRP